MNNENSNIAIKAEDLSCSFLIQKQGINSIKEFIFRVGFANLFERKKVLHDINLTIEKGECFGILGRNGSGKSTLLRAISGVMPIESGSIEVNGKVAPMMALGVGLEPELNGYANIRLLSTLMKYPKREMSDIIEFVKDFSELSDEDLNKQVKRYSSGMMARLSFSITVAKIPDILIIDEALAVGDLGFRQKCAKQIDLIRASGSTIVYVSHNMSEIKRVCTRACLLKNGRIESIGSVDDIINQYEVKIGMR